MPRKTKTPNDTHATVIVGAHLSRGERERIRVAAALVGKPLSRWLRDTALSAANAILTEKGVSVEG